MVEEDKTQSPVKLFYESVYADVSILQMVTLSGLFCIEARLQN